MKVGVICDSSSGDALTEQRLAQLAPQLALGLERVAMARDVGPADALAWSSVRRIALAKGAQILHGHGAKGGAYARLAAAALRRGGHPVLGFYTPHGGSLHYAPTSLAGRVFTGLERLLAPLSSGIIFESDFARRVYLERVGQVRAPTRVVANGLQPQEFEELPAGARPFALGFVGEMRRLKGVDVLLAAFARLRERQQCGHSAEHRDAPDAFARVRLLIVGDGPDRAAFEAQATSLGVGDRVQFAGAMPAREAFAQMDVLVVPSRAESLPYVVLEAAAAGLPLIATAVGGVPEIIAGTSHGLVPPGDEVALADAMQRVLDEPQRTQALAAELKAAVARRFTIATMSSEIGALYAEAGRNAR